MSTSQITTAEPVLATYPLPWHVVADLTCPRLVAANGATILAVNSDELPIIAHIAAATNGAGQAEELRDPIANLAGVLGNLCHYQNSDEFVDDLIIAAEAVVQAAPPAGA